MSVHGVQRGCSCLLCCNRFIESCPVDCRTPLSVLLSSSGPSLLMQGMMLASHFVLNFVALASACCIKSRPPWACRSLRKQDAPRDVPTFSTTLHFSTLDRVPVPMSVNVGLCVQSREMYNCSVPFGMLHSVARENVYQCFIHYCC